MVVITCIHQAPCISAVGYISHLGHADCLCMYKPSALELVRLRLQAVREDRLQKVSLEQPSDGPIVITEPLEHVRYCPGACWPKSVYEVRLWRRLVHGRRGPCISAAFCRPRLNCESHVSCVGHAARLATPCLMCHLCRSSCTRPMPCMLLMVCRR